MKRLTFIYRAWFISCWYYNRVKALKACFVPREMCRWPKVAIVILYFMISCATFFTRKLQPHSKIIFPRLSKIFRLSMETSTTSESIIVENWQGVRSRMNDTAISAERDPSHVRLVAVSKTKPNEDIMQLYEAGHRHFGENYFQEVSDKAGQLPSDIRWHFIGHLQSSKASKLIRNVPNLYMLETIDSAKLATKLHTAIEGSDRTESLNVLIQVDTSGEDTKSGVSMEELPVLVDHITTTCSKLSLRGVMTIGAPGDLTCFDRLIAARQVVAQQLGVEEQSLELSMGMSGDFEEAVRRGATNIRVGSTIFGPRAYPASNK